MLKVVELIDRKKLSMVKVPNVNGFPAVVFTEIQKSISVRRVSNLAREKVSDGIV